MGILSLEPGSSGHPQAEKGCPLDPKLEKGCPLDLQKDAHWTPLQSWHGCSHDCMHLEHQLYHGLSMDVLVTVCSRHELPANKRSPKQACVSLDGEVA